MKGNAMSNVLGIEIVVPDEPIRLYADNVAKSYGRSVSNLDHVMSQVMIVGEESGEFLGAYRRWIKRARRVGTREEMLNELADVLISAIHAGWLIGVDDFQAVIDAKLDSGWFASMMVEPS